MPVAPFQIECIPPAAAPAAAGMPLPPATWVARIRPASGPTLFLGVRPVAGASALSLDAELVPIVAADLLRAGWADRARANPAPIIDGPTQYRGFTLRGGLTDLFGGAAGEAWELTGLVAEPLHRPIEWAAAVTLIDVFVATVLAEDPTHG